MIRIENLLRQKMGLHAATIGSSMIERAVRLRMEAARLTDVGEYFELVKRSPEAWRELVESLVVNETWFFRDENAFKAMVQIVFGEWLPTHAKGVLRVLSVPCSTGEEPYSIAMALLDAGLPADRFGIDAVDISLRVLAEAERGVYGRNSFRSADLKFRDRHFEPVEKNHALKPGVKSAVKFQAGNLLDDAFLAETGIYDFIFCRNLLIYFDGPTQEKAMGKLHRLLSPAGVLFLGPAEVPLAMDHGFRQADARSSFACRKQSAKPVRTVKFSLPAKFTNPGKAPAAAVAPLSKPASAPGQPAVKQPAAVEVTDLAKARVLADGGHLAEAAQICETHLRKIGPAAQAYYLLGLVRDAAGAESAAADYYRKAVYLEPGHVEALMQLALVLERGGQAAQARVFRDRAERAKNPALAASTLIGA